MKWKYRKQWLQSWWNRHNPFNYRLLIYNKVHPLMKANAQKIGFDESYFYLLDKDGSKIPGQISMTIHDQVNEAAKATVTLFVDISSITNVNEQNT